MYSQITIDGPSGVGKSTLAKSLSKTLGYLYVNTGLIFRGIAWYLDKYQIPDNSINYAITDIAKHKNFVFENNTWFLNGESISPEELKTKHITKKASTIAAIASIRNYVQLIEKEIASKNNIVMEGRDIGSKVFPNAILKIYLTASIETRSERRYTELKQTNMLENRTIEDIKLEIEQRDSADSKRELDPLTKPDDAIEINSDGRTIEDIAEEIKNILLTRQQILQ
ncbi:cytidylate kinase [Candidatus Mycoplasma haematohominis]|uniref:Cytidylate kinase n=1 Tax=Candidatus Mycoplasma haematohominis TaxID=1494318 RepID=A0A478FPE1_9MOLU|nr:cytidylate kinase [Candidatus Mycoplasma haemohominis]